MIFRRLEAIASTLTPSQFGQAPVRKLEGSGPFKEIIYCSRVTPDLGVNGVYAILAQCDELNERSSVGGILLFDNRFFLQAIEGAVDVVDGTIARISHDTRHHGMKVVSESVHKTRRWSTWRMSYLGHSSAQRQLLSLHTSFGVFDPTAMAAPTLIGLMHTLDDDLGSERASGGPSG